MSESNAVTKTGGTLQSTKAYKFLTYLLAWVLVAISSAVTDGITQGEWSTLIIGAATAAGVWLTTNIPQYTKLKELTAAILTAANILVAYLFGDGFNNADLINLAILVLGVLGVIVVPNPVSGVGRGANRGLNK